MRTFWKIWLGLNILQVPMHLTKLFQGPTELIHVHIFGLLGFVALAGYAYSLPILHQTFWRITVPVGLASFLFGVVQATPAPISASILPSLIVLAIGSISFVAQFRYAFLSSGDIWQQRA